jgi:hypothetical protein
MVEPKIEMRDNTNKRKLALSGDHPPQLLEANMDPTADEKALKDIGEVTKKASPIYDSISNPVKNNNNLCF